MSGSQHILLKREVQNRPLDLIPSALCMAHSLPTVCVLMNPSVVVKAQGTGTKSLIYSWLLYRLSGWAIRICNTSKMDQLTSGRGRLQMDYLLGYSESKSYFLFQGNPLCIKPVFSHLVAHTIAKKYKFGMIVSQK